MQFHLFSSPNHFLLTLSRLCIAFVTSSAAPIRHPWRSTLPIISCSFLPCTLRHCFVCRCSCISLSLYALHPDSSFRAMSAMSRLLANRARIRDMGWTQRLWWIHYQDIPAPSSACFRVSFPLPLLIDLLFLLSTILPGPRVYALIFIHIRSTHRHCEYTMAAFATVRLRHVGHPFVRYLTCTILDPLVLLCIWLHL